MQRIWKAEKRRWREYAWAAHMLDLREIGGEQFNQCAQAYFRASDLMGKQRGGWYDKRVNYRKWGE